MPIGSIEDGHADNNRAGFMVMTAGLGNRIQIAGGDLAATNPRCIARAIEESASNTAPIKRNRIGTVCLTIEGVDLRCKGGRRLVIAHRCGDRGAAELLAIHTRSARLGPLPFAQLQRPRLPFSMTASEQALGRR